MIVETALVLAMLSGAAHGRHLDGDAQADRRSAATAAEAHMSVLAEMAPAPGRWEVEDAPAYFSDRRRAAALSESDASTASPADRTMQ